MNTDELLTAFRSDVARPDAETAQRVHARATSRRPRLPRRRAVLAIAALAVVGGVAGALSATLGGASTSRDVAVRQRVADAAVAEVQQAFGDRRVVSARLDGAELSVTLDANDPPSSAIGGFEAGILGDVVDQELHAKGLPEIDAVRSRGDGGAVYGDGVSLPPATTPLAGDACGVASNAVPAHSTVVSARVVPLIGGFCAFVLETSDPAAFAAAAPATVGTLPEMNDARPHLLEVYDDKGALQIVQWWSPFTGGEPGNVGGVGHGEGGSWARPPLCDPFALGGSASCG